MKSYEHQLQRLAEELPLEIWLRIIDLSLKDVQTIRNISIFKPELFHLELKESIYNDDDRFNSGIDVMFTELNDYQKGRSRALDKNQFEPQYHILEAYKEKNRSISYVLLSCIDYENILGRPICISICHTDSTEVVSSEGYKDFFSQGFPLKSEAFNTQVYFPDLKTLCFYISDARDMEIDEEEEDEGGIDDGDLPETLYHVSHLKPDCFSSLSNLLLTHQHDNNSHLMLADCTIPEGLTILVIENFQKITIRNCSGFDNLKHLVLQYCSSNSKIQSSGHDEDFFSLDQFNEYLVESYEFDSESVKNVPTFVPNYDFSKTLNFSKPPSFPSLTSFSVSLPYHNLYFIQNPEFLYWLSPATGVIPYDNMESLSIGLMDVLYDAEPESRNLPLAFSETIYELPLEFIGMTQLMLSFINNIIEHCSSENLETFVFTLESKVSTRFYMPKTLINKLARFKSLKDLTLFGIGFDSTLVNDEDLYDLFCFDELRTVHLYYVGILEEDHFINLKSKSLRFINFDICETLQSLKKDLNYSELISKTLTNCPAIETLQIKHTRELTTRPVPPLTESAKKNYQVPHFPSPDLTTGTDLLSCTIHWDHVSCISLTLNVLDIIQLFSNSHKYELSSCIKLSMILMEESFESFMMKDTHVNHQMEILTKANVFPKVGFVAPLLEQLILDLNYNSFNPPILTGDLESQSELDERNSFYQKNQTHLYDDLPLYYQKLLDYFKVIRLSQYYPNLKTITCPRDNSIFSELMVDRRNYGVSYLLSFINGGIIIDKHKCFVIKTYSSVEETTETLKD